MEGQNGGGKVGSRNGERGGGGERRRQGGIERRVEGGMRGGVDGGRDGGWEIRLIVVLWSMEVAYKNVLVVKTLPGSPFKPPI